MNNINSVCISGNLTRDVETKLADGTTIITFSIAFNESRKNVQSGQWEDYLNFIDCVMFGARAKKLGKILMKGSKVCVFGKLRQTRWERDGQKRSKLEIIVSEIELLGSNAGSQDFKSNQESIPFDYN